MSWVRIQNYRCYAADCMALAKKASEADRRRLVEMAAGWHELAMMLEAYMEAHPGAEPPYQPVLGRHDIKRSH